ncbi:arsenical resistance protein ArsH [Paracoccus sp. TK19116]|uniref:Arsenical resistance protein ArsH n=1 Tax=Paracoccus albicereus TaxID=2922394 RepID=A0ABT1MR06_9RHOB|nr:arsenical resistance protein ArsH [Paracoccus albicereus]MCQ0970727.1 arsenical resistance protein ArsH [Paracoccus albicereus]
MPLRELREPDLLPALSPDYDPRQAVSAFGTNEPPVRVLILYGSLRERSYSRFSAEEAARLLLRMGAEVRIFDPSGLPFPDQDGERDPAVAELIDHVIWSDAMVWSSPETHGNMSGLLKAQIDHIPLSVGAIRPSQGRCLALMQVCGGSQSFNALNSMRVLGRWMRLITIPNQSSVARAGAEFDKAGRMRPSAYYDRIVDVAEELMRITLLTRPHRDRLAERYSERQR